MHTHSHTQTHFKVSEDVPCGASPAAPRASREDARSRGDRTASEGVSASATKEKATEPKAHSKACVSQAAPRPAGQLSRVDRPRSQWRGRLVHVGLSCRSSRYRHAKLTSHIRVFFVLMSWLKKKSDSKRSGFANITPASA